MGDVYRQMDLLWDARAAVEGLLEKHLLVIIGVFFLWNLSSFPTE